MINVKWLIENMNEFWAKIQKKNVKVDELKKIVSAAVGEKDYDKEERDLMQVEVSPVSFSSHPVDAYKSFLKREIRAPIQSWKGDSYFKDFDGRGHFVLGIIKNVKKHQIGSFGDVNKSDPFFGRPYANVNLEDKSGTERRVKFTHFVFDEHSSVVDAGSGKPVLAHCCANKEFESIRVHFAVDIAKLRMKLKKGDDLTIWEKIVSGKHPARIREWPEKIKQEKMQNIRFMKNRSNRFTGVVTHVQERNDRRGAPMATFGLIDSVFHYVEVVAFASVWEDIYQVIKPGILISMPLIINAMRDSHFFEGGKVRVYR